MEHLLQHGLVPTATQHTACSRSMLWAQFSFLLVAEGAL